MKSKLRVKNYLLFYSKCHFIVIFPFREYFNLKIECRNHLYTQIACTISISSMKAFIPFYNKQINFAITLYTLTSENAQERNHKAHFEQNLSWERNFSSPIKMDVLAEKWKSKSTQNITHTHTQIAFITILYLCVCLWVY